jgi:uncharacterized membrane protein YedE/YeeE
VPNSALTLRGRAGTPARMLDTFGRPWVSPLLVTVLLGAGAWLAADAGGWRLAALLLVGGGLGFALSRSGFGFAGPWRAMLVERRGAGFRAQLALLAVLTVVFFPLLAAGEAFGRPLADQVRPVGVALLAGAFMFGLGAQLASACSSGSFAAMGAAKLRYLIVIGFMVIGATLGSAHIGWWETRSSWTSFSLLREWGPTAGMAVNLLLLGTLAWVTVRLERTRHGQLQRPPGLAGHWLRSPWPMGRGVAVLALLCLTTLLLAGRPWTIVSALPLWGAKLIGASGVPLDVAFWDYWGADSRMSALDASLWSDVTTVMIVGLVLGTALAASLAGGLRLQWRMTPGEALGAAAGGLLLGYGGLVGLGCNIGAFLAGVASGSLHGWFWLAAAFAGTAAAWMFSSLGSKLQIPSRSTA